jgi:hypothetical protein
MVKLALSLCLLTGSLIVGLPKEASAFCESYCCDAWCTSIRECFRVGSSCICRDYCTPNWGGGLD